MTRVAGVGGRTDSGVGGGSAPWRGFDAVICGVAELFNGERGRLVRRLLPPRLKFGYQCWWTLGVFPGFHRSFHRCWGWVVLLARVMGVVVGLPP